MPQITVAQLRVNDRVKDKIWGHGIALHQVRALLTNRYVITRNRQRRTASHVLIGRNDQGRCLAIPMLATEDPYIWRAVTAWYCKPSEAAKLQ